MVSTPARAGAGWAWFVMSSLDLAELPAWAIVTLQIGGAATVGLFFHFVATSGCSRLARRSSSALPLQILRKLLPASRLIFPLLAVQLVMPSVEKLPASIVTTIQHALLLLTIFASAWLAIGAIGAVTTFVSAQYRVDVSDNLRARAIHTRLDVLRRSLVVVIFVVATAMALMTFSSVRQVGATLLASAGIAGLAIGLAARPVLENLIAGIQLALTQPIRVDDVVIVEGEWGRIEEITTTYVVVRIWDERRLIVPITYFIQQPFQNWTRETADITGSVFLHADYRLPIERVRETLREIVEEEPLWDGRVCVLQVTDANERTIELRALVSAADAGRAWDLRVSVREKLIAFLQRELPDCLPRLRVENETPGGGSPAIAEGAGGESRRTT